MCEQRETNASSTTSGLTSHGSHNHSVLVADGRGAATICLIVHAVLLAYMAWCSSPTFNEPGHLVAGLSNWKYSEFHLYRVNPPLVRMMAAIPVMCAGTGCELELLFRDRGPCGVFLIGDEFVRENGEHSFKLFAMARWACIPFSMLGGAVCFAWSRQLYGPLAGLLACSLWCFYPSILGHGALITADVPAAALAVSCCYAFWRWLNSPRIGTAVLTGGVLGIGLLTKSTLVLLLIILPVLWLLYRSFFQRSPGRHMWPVEGGMIFLMVSVAVYLLNLGYGFNGSFMRLDSYRFSSELFNSLFAGNASGDFGHMCTWSDRCIQAIAVPFPKDYVYGLDLQQCDFESYSRPSYMGGRWQDRGWWYWYLYASALKSPLGLFGLGVLSVIKGMGCRRPILGALALLPLLFPPAVLFLVASSKTGFSEHLRYVLPCFPFLFILVSGAADQTVRTSTGPERWWSLNVVLRCRLSVLFGVCFILSSLWVYPHSLSYFNEVRGGAIDGWQCLVQSNYDWGQDLRFLKKWRDGRTLNDQSKPLYLAYFGNVNPRALGFTDAHAWPTVSRSRLNKRIDGACKVTMGACFRDGHYAISATLMAGYPWPPRGGPPTNGRLLPEILALLRQMEPIGRAGYSILIFDGLSLRDRAQERSKCGRTERRARRKGFPKRRSSRSTAGSGFGPNRAGG